MDLLINIKRKLDPLVGYLRLRPLARLTYRRLLKLRYGKGELSIAKQNGRLWKLDVEVALRGEFQEYDTILWLRRTVKPGDCVFDIGANVGQMTMEAAALVGSTGRVIAVEPAPGNLRLLRLHVKANGFDDRVTIVAAACAELSAGTLAFHIHGNDPNAVGSGHSIIGPSDEKNFTLIEVPLISIDALCMQFGLQPSVLKIDVEGAELAVFRGARETLKRCRPIVLFGFHPFAFTDPSAVTESISRILKSANYSFPNIGAESSLALKEYEVLPLSQS